MKFARTGLLLSTLAAIAAAQSTTLPLDSLRPGAVSGVLVLTAAGEYKIAALGPNLTLDTSADPPKLVWSAPAVMPPATVINERVYVIRASSAQTVVVIPDPSFIKASLVVIRNGLELSEPDDYAVNALAVAFVARQTPKAGDILKLRYRIP